MKSLSLLSFLMFFALAGISQVSDPVQWLFSAKKINASTYEVRLSAKLEKGWHIYSQNTPEGGPVPTTISFAKNPLIKISDSPKELGKLEQHFEKLFGVDVKQYSNQLAFIQVVTVKAGIKTALKGSIEYMTCNDHECMPPRTVNFSVDIK
jgi:DsbC/DsbD-like thiol-disulfide interchange protein